MKLYGIRFAKGFRYGTRETAFSSEKGNQDRISDFPFFFYLAEFEGAFLLFDTGFRDKKLADDMGVVLLQPEEEIKHIFGGLPEISTIFITHSHWDHISNIDLYPGAGIIMSEQAYVQAHKDGSQSVTARLEQRGAEISLVDNEECFYGFFEFKVIAGHTPDSSIIKFTYGGKDYCITGDECYLCDNMLQNIPIGISSSPENNQAFIQYAHDKKWIPLPFHDALILEQYDRLSENIARII